MEALNAIRLRGWVGVDVFFVLSGFLITGVLYDTREDSRFLPAVFRAAGVAHLSGVLSGGGGAAGADSGLRLSVAWLDICCSWFTWGIFRRLSTPSLYQVVLRISSRELYLAHLWSLCVEEQFYLLWPLLVWRMRDRVRLLWTAAGLELMALGLRGVDGALLAAADLRGGWLINYTLPFRMDALLIGADAGSAAARGCGGAMAAGRANGCCWSAGSLVGAIFMLSPAANSPWMPTFGFTLIALAGRGVDRLGSGPGDDGGTSFFACGLCGSWAGTAMGFMSTTCCLGQAWVYVAERLTGMLHSGVMAGGVTTLVNFGLTFLVAKWSYDWFEVRFLRLKVRFAYDARRGSAGERWLRTKVVDQLIQMGCVVRHQAVQ